LNGIAFNPESAAKAFLTIDPATQFLSLLFEARLNDGIDAHRHRALQPLGKEQKTGKEQEMGKERKKPLTFRGK
jgi:hypothetical protein